MIYILFCVLFIAMCVLTCVIIYKLKLIDNDIETLYDNYFKYIENSFNREEVKKNV